MVSIEASSTIVYFANKVNAELSQPDAGSERRLFDLYRLATADDKPAVVLAMIGELLHMRLRHGNAA